MMPPTTADANSRKPVAAIGQTAIRPFEVCIDGPCKGRFEDLKDAISSAKIAKIDRPLANVTVVDGTTGQVVIEVGP
jgi:hypothetical protein